MKELAKMLGLSSAGSETKDESSEGAKIEEVKDEEKVPPHASTDFASGARHSLTDLIRKLAELKDSHVGLQNRHLDLARGHQQTLQNCEDVQQRMQKLTNRFENQKAEVGHAILALNDRAFDAEKFSMEMREELEGLGELQRRMDDRMNDTLGDLSDMTKSFDAIKGSVEDTKHKVEDQLEDTKHKLEEDRRKQSQDAQTVGQRIVTLESSMLKLSQGHHSETEKNTRNRNLVDELSKEVSAHTTTLEKNKVELYSFEGTQQRMDEHLQSMESRMKHLEEQEGRLDERLQTTDAAMGVLGAFREDAAVKIDLHHLELERGKTQQDQLRSDLGQANVALQGLSSDVATTSARLGHVADRVNLAHEYFDGMGKGMQDMHRHALGGTGTGGMLPLPPKSPQKSGTLPDISSRAAQALPH